MSEQEKGFTISTDRMIMIGIACVLAFSEFKDTSTATSAGMSETIAEMRVEIRNMSDVTKRMESFMAVPRYTASDHAQWEGRIREAERKLDDRTEFMTESQLKDARHDEKLADIETRVRELEAE